MVGLFHSFILAISIAPSSTTYRRSRLQHGYCIGVSRRSAQATVHVGKGLAQGPYVAARAGVEPTTLRLKVVASTKIATTSHVIFRLHPTELKKLNVNITDTYRKDWVMAPSESYTPIFTHPKTSNTKCTRKSHAVIRRYMKVHGVITAIQYHRRQ